MANKYASKEEREAADFERWGVTPPKVAPHGTEKEIRENLKAEMPHTWRQSGNQLIGESERGHFSQTIPTSHILIGTDSKGLSIFKKIEL